MIYCITEHTYTEKSAILILHTSINTHTYVQPLDVVIKVTNCEDSRNRAKTCIKVSLLLVLLRILLPQIRDRFPVFFKVHIPEFSLPKLFTYYLILCCHLTICSCLSCRNNKKGFQILLVALLGCMNACNSLSL